MAHLNSILISLTYSTQDINAIKVLSIMATVAVLEETQHKKCILKLTLQ